jgi:hypothetical protein
MFGILAATAIVWATGAQANPSVQQAPSAAAPAAPVKEKKTCRVEASTGSMMAKRTCHTAAEWAAIDRANPGVTDAMLHQQQQMQRNMH